MNDTLYGPFFDEELFYYYDKTTLELEQLEIYEVDVGFIGFDRLEKIYALGSEGSFDNVMFSGRVTLNKTSCLCEGGLKKLLQQAQKQDPTMDAYKLQKACRHGEIKIELLCQLALMPVCYLTKCPANSILIYSRNQNNVNNQRRYIVNTFHIVCFRRSELTLHRYYVLKFVIDACQTHGLEVPRGNRDVHWLVEVYMEDYLKVFGKYGRPRLHRSEVYDHFATHAEWLKKVFTHKALVDRGKWKEWVAQAKRLRRKAKRADSKWGSPMTTSVAPLRPRHRLFSLKSNEPDHDNLEADYRNIVVNFPSSDTDTSNGDFSSSSSDSDGDVQYTHEPRLLSRAHRGLLLPMPAPTWHWSCNIKSDCPFVIDIGNRRRREAPCMEPLSKQQKDYLIDSKWGLYDKKLVKIWKIMCQAHMDWHWREAGLVLDHERRMIYGVEEEDNEEAE